MKFVQPLIRLLEKSAPPKILTFLKKIKKNFRNKRHKLTDFPPMVMLETTTRCNLACNHCPNSVLSKDKEWVGDMDIKLYRNLIDEITQEDPATVVRPFDSGEPLLRKDMEEMIEYAKDKGIHYVSINTNGVLLNENRSKKLLKSGLDHIEISVDAVSGETFKKIKNVDLYERVKENILRLIQLRDDFRPDFIISVSFVKQRDNAQEADAFYVYWRDKVDRVYIRKYHRHANLVEDLGSEDDRKTGKHKIRKRHPCPYLWDRIIIQHDGRVRFCENDWKAEHALGNAWKQTLKEIWTSDAYRKLRESHLKGTFDHPFCRDCPDWPAIK